MLEHIEAEQSIIGLALEDLGCAENLASLPEDAFTTRETRTLYKVIKGCLQDHEIPNLISVGRRLTENVCSVLECGNICLRMAIGPAMYKQLEIEIMDLRRRRALQKVCMDIVNTIGDPNTDIDRIADKITQIINDTGPERAIMNMPRALDEFFDSLDNDAKLISTGIARLDRVIGGLQGGMLAVLGARPKVGKSALALTISIHVARSFGPVLYISLEMGTRELMQRIISAESQTDLHRIVNKTFSSEERIKMENARLPLSKIPFEFEEGLRTPLQIRRKAASKQRNEGLAMIVIDYIQLLKSDEPRKSRYEEMCSITRDLKLVAMDLDVPILALTQFNRESEQGGTKRKPTMSEARDSGSIEQDANMFIIQYSPRQPQPDEQNYTYWKECQEEKTEFQILEIAANRQGPTGSIPMKFDKCHMKFSTKWKKRD